MEIVQKFNRGLVKWIVIYAMEYDRIIKEKSDFFSLEEDTLNCLLTVVSVAQMGSQGNFHYFLFRFFFKTRLLN